MIELPARLRGWLKRTWQYSFLTVRLLSVDKNWCRADGSLKWSAKRSSRLFRLAGAKNWIWSLLILTEVVIIGLRLVTFQTFETAVAQKCVLLWCVTLCAWVVCHFLSRVTTPTLLSYSLADCATRSYKDTMIRRRYFWLNLLFR